jgi:hypothetical protein
VQTSVPLWGRTSWWFAGSSHSSFSLGFYSGFRRTRFYRISFESRVALYVNNFDSFYEEVYNALNKRGFLVSQSAYKTCQFVKNVTVLGVDSAPYD